MPPPDPPDVGPARQVTVTFPEDDWTFVASFQAASRPCARRQEVTLSKAGPQTWVLGPAGPAGAYEIQLSGSAERQGSVATTFRWTTLVRGPLAVPNAGVIVLAGYPHRVESYGVGLDLINLARTPRSASASIDVTSAEGRRIRLDLDKVRVPEGCEAEGSVRFTGLDAQGQAAAALGRPPFAYDVRLRLDGRPYRATASWPDDELPDYRPSVGLRFTPWLPALQR